MGLRIAELETLFTANTADFDKGATKVETSQKSLSKSDPKVKVAADTTGALGDLDRVHKSSKKLGDDAPKIVPKVDPTKAQKDIEALQAKSHAAMTDIGQVGIVAGAAVAAGVGLAVSKFTEFDAAMSQAQAGTMATGKALGDLRAAAIQQGAATQYSASEAANAITEMGKAGVSTSDILGGGLAGALSLAASGQIAVGRAGEIAATSMNQFGLTGKDLPHVADLMAAGAGKAQGSVEDMANAMKYVGPVAKNLNVSIEQTTGVIAELASQGIIGEQAGTSLRGMLLSLTSPSALAAKEMAKLGLNVYDASGKFVGLDGVAQQMKDTMGGLDDATRNEAMGRIFGNEQITAATILYNGGAKAVEDWTNKVNDSGFAARQAAMLTDNLKGDMERLGGSIDTALIQTGSGANDVLRSMAQNAEGLVNILGAINPTALTTGLVILSAVAAVGLLGGGLLILVPKIAATKLALDDLAVSHKGTANVIKGVGVAAGVAAGVLTVGAIAFGIWAAHAADARAKVDALADTLDKTTGAITDMTRENVKSDLAQKKTLMGFITTSDSAYNNAKKLGISLDVVTDAALGNADALKKVNDILLMEQVGSKEYDDAVKRSGLSYEAYGVAVGQLWNALDGSNGSLDEAVQITHQKAAADKQAATDADTLTSAVDFTTKATDRQVVSFEDLLQAQSDLAGIQMSAAEAEAAWAQQVMDNGEALKGLNDIIAKNAGGTRDASDAVKDGGASLDLYTEAGQFASSTLLDTSNAAWKLLDAAKAGGAGTDEMRQKTSDARSEFIKTATQMGLTEQAANDLADQYGLIPKKTETKAELDKVQAEADLDALAAEIRALPNGIVSIQTVGYAQTYAYLTQTQDLINKLNGTHVRIAMGPAGQGGITEENGGTVRAADGLDRQSMIAPGGSNILWAEPATGWETYISGKPSQRARNINLLTETARRFGLVVLPVGTQTRADGGTSVAAAPAPYGGPALQITVQGNVVGDTTVRDLRDEFSWAMMGSGVR